MPLALAAAKGTSKINVVIIGNKILTREGLIALYEQSKPGPEVNDATSIRQEINGSTPSTPVR